MLDYDLRDLGMTIISPVYSKFSGGTVKRTIIWTKTLSVLLWFLAFKFRLHACLFSLKPKTWKRRQGHRVGFNVKYNNWNLICCLTLVLSQLIWVTMLRLTDAFYKETNCFCNTNTILIKEYSRLNINTLSFACILFLL